MKIAAAIGGAILAALILAMTVPGPTRVGQELASTDADAELVPGTEASQQFVDPPARPVTVELRLASDPQRLPPPLCAWLTGMEAAPWRVPPASIVAGVFRSPLVAIAAGSTLHVAVRPSPACDPGVPVAAAPAPRALIAYGARMPGTSTPAARVGDRTLSGPLSIRLEWTAGRRQFLAGLPALTANPALAPSGFLRALLAIWALAGLGLLGLGAAILRR